MKYKRFFLYIAIILLTSVPLMNDFLIRGHDIYFHLMRIEGLAEGLQCGQFPVRIQPVWYGGFGYAVSVFYGDLFVYFAAFLRILGFSLQNAYKGYLLLCNIVTVAVSGYSFGHIFKNRYIGVFGSALYSLAVYRLVNLYTRGALGEYTGMAFLPLIIYACVLLLGRERKKEDLQKGSLLLGVSMAAIVQSHILTAELTCLMLCLVVILYIWRIVNVKVLLSGLKSVGIATGLSLWFLVPFMDYMMNGTYNVNNTREEEMIIQKLGILKSQVYALFDNAIGESLDVAAGPQGDFAQGVGLGLFTAIPVLMALILLQYRVSYKEWEWKLVLTSAFLGCTAIALSTVYFPWDYLCSLSSLLKFFIVKIQFPWRFTGIAVVCLVLLWCGIAAIVYKKYGRAKSIILSLAVIIMILLSAGYYYIDLFDRGQRIQINNQGDMDTYVASGEEYIPMGTVIEELRPENLLIEEGLELTAYKKNGTTIGFHCKNSSGEDKILELPLLYYPGYRAVGYAEDGKTYNVGISEGKNNVVRLVIEENTEYDIRISFCEPWYWRVSELFSLVCAIWLLGNGLYKVRKAKRMKNF